MLMSRECSPDSQVKVKPVGGSWPQVLPTATKANRDIHMISFMHSKIVVRHRKGQTGQGRLVSFSESGP